MTEKQEIARLRSYIKMLEQKLHGLMADQEALELKWAEVGSAGTLAGLDIMFLKRDLKALDEHVTHVSNINTGRYLEFRDRIAALEASAFARLPPSNQIKRIVGTPNRKIPPHLDKGGKPSRRK